MNLIVITKLTNGDFRVRGPNRDIRLGKMMNVVTEVRTQLNYLKLPVDARESELGHNKFCQCDICIAERAK